MPNSLNNSYSYQLIGIDNDWSNWQQLSFKEYNLLTPGEYTFKVKRIYYENGKCFITPQSKRRYTKYFVVHMCVTNID